MEESTALSSNKESKPVVSEIYTVEKEEAVEDEVSQHRDADTLEEKGGVTLGSKAGINEIPLGEWKPIAEQPALAALFTGEREVPQGIASKAEAEGARELDEEGLNPMGKEAARVSGSLNEEEAPEHQVLMQTVLEREKAASEEEQSSEKAVSASKATAQISECVQEVAALRETVMPEKGESERGVAVSEAGSEKPDMEDSEEEASLELGDMTPEDDTAFERADGSEETRFGGEEPAKVRKTVMRTETSLSSSTSEKAETTRMRISEESLEELCKTAEKRKDVETEVESHKKDDRKETLPEELDAAKQRRKAERPRTPLEETEPEREELIRENALQDEDILAEEQKFEGKEGEIVKEVRPVEEILSPPDETGCDVENAARMKGPAWTEHTGPQGDDAQREREVAMLEAAPEFEKSSESTLGGRKEGGGERLREAGDTGRKGRAELLCRENGERVAPSDQDHRPGPEGEGVSGAPESDPSGHTQERRAEDQDGLSELEREKEESLQGRQGVGAMAMTQEDISEGVSMRVEKLSEEVMDKDPEEEVDQECSLGTGAMKNGHTEGVGSLQGRTVVAKYLQEGGVAEMAGLKTAERKTEANPASSLSHVADEKTWHKVDELLEKTASVEKVVGEEIALSREGVPAVEEVTVIGASEAEVGALGEPSDLEEKTSQLGPDQKGREAGMGSHGGGQESGKAEDVRLGLSQQAESDLSRESLQDVEILPGKANCPGIQEKQEHTVQRESENTDVSLNSTKA